MRLGSLALGMVAMALLPRTLRSQESASLATILSPFLVDSGVRTRGLPWSTGSTLGAITWETDTPVAAAQYLVQEGLSLERKGAGWLRLGADDSLAATLSVQGNQAGIQRVQVGIGYEPNGPSPLERIEATLAADGVRLLPLKCDRAAEGVSLGNLVSIVAAPGKQGVGFWVNWNCGHDFCGMSFALLYHRRDVATVECAGS